LLSASKLATAMGTQESVSRGSQLGRLGVWRPAHGHQMTGRPKQLGLALDQAGGTKQGFPTSWVCPPSVDVSHQKAGTLGVQYFA
jgi:hypothetical protein